MNGDVHNFTFSFAIFLKFLLKSVIHLDGNPTIVFKKRQNDSRASGQVSVFDPRVHSQVLQLQVDPHTTSI